MIKVLHVLSGIGYQGGVQSLIWNYYKHIDHNQIRFDFLAHSKRMEGYENRFTEKKSRIFYAPPKKEGLIKNYKAISRVIRDSEYNVVHVHQDFLGFVALLAAKKAGIKVRIMHSHKANMEEGLKKRIIRKLLTKLCVSLATDLFACGEDAAKWTYGDELYRNNKIYVLKNAIEPSEFIFDSRKRLKMRELLGLREEDYVIGNVARFTYQKNHDLLIDVFEQVLNNNPTAKLLLVGDGELFEEIQAKVKEKKLEKSVMFLGERSDVKDLLQAMDIFVLTSRFEGLPVTMVEAQTSDLPCVVSNNITHEIDINEKTKYVNLDAPLSEWTGNILEYTSNIRNNMLSNIKDRGFDINTEVKNLVDFYSMKSGK